MPTVSVHQNHYVIVNIWTSDRNKALKGANVGHISLTTSKGHISLWPGSADSLQNSPQDYPHPMLRYRKKNSETKSGTKAVEFFSHSTQPASSVRTIPPAQYLEDYEQDCLRETSSESGRYELCLTGFQLCMKDEHTQIGENKIYIDLIRRYNLSLMSDNTQFASNKLYVALDDSGLIYNALTSSDERISGCISYDILKSISEDLGELEGPLTKEHLHVIGYYYDELINVMLPEHQKEIAQRVIKYFVKSPKGKVVEEEIRDNIILSDGRNLLDVLLEGRNLVEMQSLLPSILSITSRRKHTRTNSENTIIESRKLYLSLSTEGALRYQVRLPSKEIATGLISKAELKQIHPYLATLSSPLTMLDLGLFERFKDEILKLTARNGHTKEVLFRSVTHDHQLSAGEVLYRLDNTDETFESVAEVPQRYPAQYSFLAVKLIHANFRVALYSLDENAIDQFFNTLKHSGGVSGWTMQGSNLFTRTYHHTTTESCASLAYRCLIAGGFYMALKTKLSSQTSSIVSPDDLLRHVVAFKQKELIPFPETERWISQEVDISSFNQAKIAYSQVNQNANAEDDILPLIPSIPRWSIPGCSIM